MRTFREVRTFTNGVQKTNTDLKFIDSSSNPVITSLVSIQKNTISSVPLEYIYDMDIVVHSKMKYPIVDKVYNSDILVKDVIIKNYNQSINEDKYYVAIHVYNLFDELPDIIKSFKENYFKNFQSITSKNLSEYQMLVSYYFYNLLLISSYLNLNEVINQIDNNHVIKILTEFWNELVNLNNQLINQITNCKLNLHNSTKDMLNETVNYLQSYNSYFEDYIYKYKLEEFPIQTSVILNKNQRVYLIHQAFSDVIEYARSSNNTELIKILDNNYINSYTLLDESTFKL